MLEVDRIKHKALRAFYRTGEPKGLHADWVSKLRRMLQALDAITHPEELRGLPAWRLHELKGDREGTWSLRVTGNWRVTFRWDDEGPFDVDLEDYHG